MIKNLLLLAFVCASVVSFGQNRVVTGRVTSADDGQGIPGANILLKGTNTGTTTNADGDFSLTIGNDAILVISYIGYTTQEVVVGSQSRLTVSLQTDITALQEIVVVGYGEVQKKDATGAVTAISNKDFNKGVLMSPQDLLTGRIAGVSVISNSGAPGAASQIRIRGGASLTANNDPLIVIDGFPVDATDPGGIANPLATLNPNDIETFTVLKDASATAIYGSRASNGVIIITTKKGKAGKVQWNYNGNVSVSSPMKFVDVLNATEYKALVNDLSNQGTFGITPTALGLLGNADTDWQREIFRTSISHDHNVSASGTVKNLPYRVSYGYTNQQGILKTTGMQRHSINLNLTPTFLNGDLKVTASAKASHAVSNFGDEGAIGNAISFDPTQPVRDGNETYGGYFSWLSKGTPQITNGNSNPVAMLEQTNNQGTNQRFIGNAQFEYKLPFLRELKAVLNLGLDVSSTEGFNRAPLNSGFIHSTGTLTGRNNTYSGKNQSELLDLYFNYTKDLGIHRLDATLGYGWQHFYRTRDSRNENAIQTVDPPPSPSENYLVSFFGRLNYTLNGKYLLTATLRNDGTSRVAPENRWGLFPSLALAWRLKDEGFLSSVSAVSDLKLRVGYGVTGQQDVAGAYYPYLAVYRTSNDLAQYQLGNSYFFTLRPEAYDPNIKWEETTTYNVGLDFGFLNDKITGSIELFQKNTKDLLNNIGIPNGVNFSNFLTTNVGSMENQGIEIALNYSPFTRPDFSWTIGVNFTSINSTITKLNLTDDPNYPGVFLGNVGVGANVQNHRVGFPASSYFVYQQVYDENGKPVEGLYVNRSGGDSPAASEANKYHFNRPVADYLIGINSRGNYKKFDFSFASRMSIGNYLYNNVEAGYAYYNGVYTQQHFRNIPSMVTDAGFVGQQVFSDYYVQNASFFKLDNASVGYNLDNVVKQGLKARISLTVQNAFIITKYKGLDPESVGGIDNNIYPRPRTFLLGLNVTF
ncbi:MAG: TonB-dependent receptor [Cyclobacteriaceae bacterium]|nr:TonB-dependent receptor [Cyclobacteriaceae bacterium]